MITEGGAPRRVEVPVEMPEGMSYEGVFGSENRLQAAGRPMSMAVVDRTYPSGGGGVAMPVPIMQSPKAALMRAQEQVQASNLDPAIGALIARVKAGNRPGIDEAKFVFGGDAYIRLTLTDASADIEPSASGRTGHHRPARQHDFRPRPNRKAGCVVQAAHRPTHLPTLEPKAANDHQGRRA